MFGGIISKMKISLVVEKNKKVASVSFTAEEIRDIYDWFYICDLDCKFCRKNKKLNKIDKGLKTSYTKFMHIVHDIIDEGKVSRMKKVRNKIKFVPVKKRHYFVRKPLWRKGK